MIVPENISEVAEFIKSKDYFGFDTISFSYSDDIKRLVANNEVNDIELYKQQIKEALLLHKDDKKYSNVISKLTNLGIYKE